MSFTIYAQLAPKRKPFAPGVHVCANVAALRLAGHTQLSHGGKTYEVVNMPDTLIAETRVGPISVRNHTPDELTYIQQVLARVPSALMTSFVARYTGIVCVDWTGSDWGRSGPGATTLLSGGGHINRQITRNGITESGLRIELTHSAMYETRPHPYGRRGVYTFWHELGHAAYNLGMIPRTVSRTDYGESIHIGASEQPAYAFMWYYLNPARLAPEDRAAFASRLGSSGSPTPAAPTSPATPSVTIGQAVGEGAPNNVPDVRVVQELLNQHLTTGTAPLPVNGVCDLQMIERIRAFQRSALQMRNPDGRVDPGGRTLQALNS